MYVPRKAGLFIKAVDASDKLDISDIVNISIENLPLEKVA
jgi:hypothetical protein